MKNIVEDLKYLSLYATLGSLIYRAEDLPLNRMCSVRPLTLNKCHERHTLCKVLQTMYSFTSHYIYIRALNLQGRHFSVENSLATSGLVFIY